MDAALSTMYPTGPMAVDDQEAFVANPINGFGMMERMGKTLNRMEIKKSVEETVEIIKEKGQRLVEAMETFPSFDAYADTASGLVRL